MPRRYYQVIVASFIGHVVASTAASAGNISLETVSDLSVSCKVYERLNSEKTDIPTDAVLLAVSCRVFFQGFIAGHNTVLAWAHEKGTVTEVAINRLTMYCAPRDATIRSAITKFLTWADSHPEAQQWLAGLGVGWALETAWPCGKEI